MHPNIAVVSRLMLRLAAITADLKLQSAFGALQPEEISFQ